MKILVIAPHPDDEVLGCGGIISRFAKEGHQVFVCIATKGCLPLFDEKDNIIDKKECLEAHKIMGVKDTIFLDFPAAMLETVPRNELNKAFIELIQKVKPEEVYIPHKGDMHIDHKMIVDACMVALRPRYEHIVKRIYAYETLSETDWDIPNTVNAFIPNVYVDIVDEINNKVNAMKAYKHQICKCPNPRSKEGIVSLAQHRGMTVGMKYAESFMLIRDIK
ncbi:MAG: PIG-L family deacetylase [Firmicutes bacterium]|nr:PIG-L family deacetylase [Candidatus Colivicinus equi]